MTAIVLDTNVISELVRLAPEPKVVKFLGAVEDPIVSAIVFHELAYGVERLRDAAKRMKLELFLQGAKAMYEGRIVGVDLALAELARRLRAQASRSGWVLAQFDSLVSATAIQTGSKLAARNIVDFERLGLAPTNPWAD
ncbi:MAG TPA: PIN domain-containing protein [Roseiarcus sp.]|nr:PIN domain-containing protein [Roseiarcus sp.]